MAGEFLHLGVAEHRFQLIFGDRKIGAVAEPRLHLGTEAALLQRGHKPVEIMVLRFRQHGVDQRRQCGRFDLAKAPLSASPRPRLSNNPMTILHAQR